MLKHGLSPSKHKTHTGARAPPDVTWERSCVLPTSYWTILPGLCSSGKSSQAPLLPDSQWVGRRLQSGHSVCTGLCSVPRPEVVKSSCLHLIWCTMVLPAHSRDSCLHSRPQEVARPACPNPTCLCPRLQPRMGEGAVCWVKEEKEGSVGSKHQRLGLDGGETFLHVTTSYQTSLENRSSKKTC